MCVCVCVCVSVFQSCLLEDLGNIIWKNNFYYYRLLMSLCIHVCLVASVVLSVTLWTVAHQAPLSMVFSRQEYRSGFPWPPPGDLPNPGIKPVSPASPASQADSLSLRNQGRPFNVLMKSMNFSFDWLLVSKVSKVYRSKYPKLYIEGREEKLQWKVYIVN